MGLGDSIRNMIKTLRLAKKSTREEYLLYLKMVLAGMAIVGAIGFIIQFLASLIGLAR
ncbi:MAG: protein translocase SEC61 complex subunit gamma [Nitrososphaerales archaeon]